MSKSLSPKNVAILKRGLYHIQKLDYKPSTRYVFYRLFQEGYYNDKKKDYQYFIKVSSKARHKRILGWSPDSMIDDTRQTYPRHGYFTSPGKWIAALIRSRCSLDEWYHQPFYIECWFEARAMVNQFLHYTKHVTLKPCGGQAPIYWKWQAAKDIEEAVEKYNHPIAILYFGDLDIKGIQISETIERDVRKWCKSDFRFFRCGLTKEQAIKYNLPENPTKPGQFQWESLDDPQAKEIITESLKPYLDEDAFIKNAEKEEEITTRWYNEITKNIRHLLLNMGFPEK